MIYGVVEGNLPIEFLQIPAGHQHIVLDKIRIPIETPYRAMRFDVINSRAAMATVKGYMIYHRATEELPQFPLAAFTAGPGHSVVIIEDVEFDEDTA